MESLQNKAEDFLQEKGAGNSEEEVEMTYEEFLIYSARIGELEDVQFCITEKVDLNTIDKSGNSALHMACANGHIGIAT